jgi:hypothetical protein
MKGSRTPWLPGYRIKVLDGNCLKATEHRLDVFPCKDGHAQERPLIESGTAYSGCPGYVDHGSQLLNRQGYFIYRQHQGLPYEQDSEARFVGRGERGAIYEQ